MNFDTINRLIARFENGKRPWLILAAGTVIFGVMGVIAWILFRERMLNFDPAFFSFLMIQEEWFSPVLNRYGTILSQLIPLGLIKSGADLKTVLQFYSLSFVILYFVYLLIIGIGFKDRGGIIALCVALTLTFRETFYYATAELYQGIGLAVVLWVVFRHALSTTGTKRSIGLVASALLVFCISFFHQLGVFLTLFVLLSEYINRKNWKDKGALAVIAWTVVWFGIRIKFLTVSEYEQERLMTLDSFLNNIGNLANLETTKYFVEFFKNHLVLPAGLFVAGLIYVFRKNKTQALFIALFTLGFWLIIMIGLRHERSPIMLQNYYTVFGLFAGVLFALVLRNQRDFVIALFIFGLCLFSLKNVYQARYDYKQRTEFLDNINTFGQQFPEKKYVVHAHHLPWGYVWINWALPFETLMNSELNPEHETVSFFSTFELDSLDYFDVERPESFLGASFEPHWFSSTSLNSKYFDLKEGPYRILSTVQEDLSVLDSLLASPEVQLVPTSKTINKGPGYTSFRMTVKNTSDALIGSVPHKNEEGRYLYFRVIDADGNSGRPERRRILFDLIPGKEYLDIVEYTHPGGHNQWLEIGFCDEERENLIPKATIGLNASADQ